MTHIVWEHYDGKKYREECAEILADAYMFNNPLVKPLNLTKKNMIQDFLNQLDKQIFKYVFIFFESNSYKQGLKEIVGVACTGDILDFQNQSAIANYDQVPDSSLVRTYMRYKTLEPFWEQQKTKVNKNEYFYGGNFGIKPKYMGKGVISYQICYEATTYMKSLGFKYGIVNAINSLAKRLLEKLSFYSMTINLEQMYILSDQSYPFKEKGLSQVLYVGDINHAIQVSHQIVSKRLPNL